MNQPNRIFRQIYVMLTHKCPLNCEYCYIDKSGSRKDMEWKTIKYIMDVVRPELGGGRGLVFFGGEPLLRVDLIEKTLKEYAKDMPDGIGGVVTSASVNMDKFFPLYRDFNMFLQVSYDGLAHSNSRHKKFDFDVLKPYFELENKRFQLRKTVSECNIDTLFEDYKVGREFSFKYDVSFDYSIAHQESFSAGFWNKLHDHYTDIWGFIFRTITEKDRTYIPLTLMRDLAHVSSYLKSDYKPRRLDSCEVGHILVVDGNGDCYPCTMLSQLGHEFKVGNVYGKIDLEKASCYSAPLDCNCPYSIVCGGGCRWERYKTFGKDGMRTNKLPSTCKMLHVKYMTANNFLNSLDNGDYEFMMLAIKRYEQAQKLTFDMGMYEQANAISRKTVNDIENYGLISWR